MKHILHARYTGLFAILRFPLGRECHNAFLSLSGKAELAVLQIRTAVKLLGYLGGPLMEFSIRTAEYADTRFFPEIEQDAAQLFRLADGL